MTPHGDDGDGDDHDDGHENVEDRVEAAFDLRQRLVARDLADQDPRQIGDRPRRGQHFFAQIVLHDPETARLLDRDRRREVGRVDRERAFKRRGVVGEGRQVFHGPVGPPDEVGLCRGFGRTGLDEPAVKAVIDDPQADDDTDPFGALVRLNAEHRQGEADGGQVACPHERCR